MKIENLNPDYLTFRDIEESECFISNGQLCMKISEWGSKYDDTINAIRITDGAVMSFSDDKPVRSVNAKVVIE